MKVGNRTTKHRFIEQTTVIIVRKNVSDLNWFQNDISIETEKVRNRRSASFLKTESREVSDRDLSDVSEDMQVKSRLLVSFQ